MEKQETIFYPGANLPQRTLSAAALTMLNCGVYLKSQGFKEFVSSNHSSTRITGTISFPDGSTLFDSGWVGERITEENRDSLLKKIISTKASYVVDKYCKWSPILRTYAGPLGIYESSYNFEVHISYAAEDSYFNFFKKEKSTPLNFKNKVIISFNQAMISDLDLETFAKYKKDLEDIIKQDTILTFPPKTLPTPNIVTPIIASPIVKPTFIDPWEIEIPKLG